MKKINLRELYPDVYTTDFFVDVTEEVMETIRAAERAEAAYERKMYRYKAQYSLDCENGIENAVLLKPQTPEMVLEEKQFQEQVYAAVYPGSFSVSLTILRRPLPRRSMYFMRWNRSAITGFRRIERIL